MSEIRHITLPAGFVAAGVTAGIKVSGKPDLAVIVATGEASMAVVTTSNQVFGEPVRYIRDGYPKGFGKARGIVINSGCSNVCTGRPGYRDAVTMAADVAKLVGTTPDNILVASTGIIGHRLPMDKIRKGIPLAVKTLGTGNDEAVIASIMTTDTRPKTAVVQTRIDGKRVTLAGIIKGAGMIAPSLATMIGVITTDAAVAPAALHKALQAASAATFNGITVDSDTSTSDTVAVFASGAAGNKTVTGGAAYETFAAALREVCDALARAVVADGEGATKVVDVVVRSARNDADAKLAAKSVADSPLFKCAVHGGDPNWGRIACALGKSAAKVDPATLTISIGGVKVFHKGGGTKFDVKKVEQHLAGKAITIVCDLGLGKGEFTAITCDFSHDYVTINADYHT